MFTTRSNIRLAGGSIITLCVAALAGAAAPGCTSTHGKRPDPPAAALQDQRWAATTGARYASVFRRLEDGQLDGAKDDMDLWIDMSILQLKLLEEHHPSVDWAAVEVDPAHTSGLRMDRLYRAIARFRRDHPPRQQSFPWDAESLKRIEAFVEKYQ